MSYRRPSNSEWLKREEKRDRLVSSKTRDDGRLITYREWRSWCHQWRVSDKNGRHAIYHSTKCFCGIPEPRIKVND